MQMMNAGIISPLQKNKCFLLCWTAVFLCGGCFGLMVVRDMKERPARALAALCTAMGDTLSPWALFGSALLLFAVTFLLSRLTCGAAFVLLLTGCKGFCTAFVWCALARFQHMAVQGHALFRFSIHSLLLIPAYCALCNISCTASFDCGKFFTDRRRFPAVVFPFLWLVAAAVAERLLWQ